VPRVTSFISKYRYGNYKGNGDRGDYDLVSISEIFTSHIAIPRVKTGKAYLLPDNTPKGHILARA